MMFMDFHEQKGKSLRLQNSSKRPQNPSKRPQKPSNGYKSQKLGQSWFLRFQRICFKTWCFHKLQPNSKLRINISIVSMKYIISTYTINILYYIILYHIISIINILYILYYNIPATYCPAISIHGLSANCSPELCLVTSWGNGTALLQRRWAPKRRPFEPGPTETNPTGFSRCHGYFAGQNGWKCMEGLRVPTFLVGNTWNWCRFV